MPAPLVPRPAQRPARSLLPTVAAVLAVATALAGCSRAPMSDTGRPAPITSLSIASTADTGSAGSTASTLSTPAGPSSSGRPSSAPASSSQPSSTPPPTGPASPVASQPDGPGGCATAVLRVRALRASGAAGHQYAFLSFTNTSATPCSLTGFPGVRLLRAGAPLGSAAQRSAKPANRVQIAPGDSVTAQLMDDSTCNADNSDAVEVIPPNRTERFVLPLTLRGCSLHIDPVGAG
jgi:hypothetical protein